MSAPVHDGIVAVRPRSVARLSGYAGKAALVLGVLVGGLWTSTHRVAGVAWVDVLDVLRAVPGSWLAMLAAVWLAGLAIYATVLASALPGLGVGRGLVMNLSGSAVANTVPLGGAVATGLNWRMARRWGHSNHAFVTFCALTNALDVAAKLLLPVVAIVALVGLSVHVPTALWLVTAASGTTGALLLLVLGGSVRFSGRRWPTRLAPLLAPLAKARTLFVARWARLLPGSVAYVAAQVLLLGLSLRAVGLHAPMTVVLMAAAIERLGTLVPITPGGAGIAEVGTIAWLVANGLDPVTVVAGVLLYRVFLVVMEIPVGAVLLAGWAWVHRTVRPRPLAGVRP